MAKIALFGMPAAGKGTLAESLQEILGYPKFSTGALFRRLRADDPGPVGEQLRRIPPHAYAPDELTLRAVAMELADESKYGGGVMFDGFPRTVGQVMALDEQGVVLDAVIFLDAPEAILLGRAATRLEHAPSGRSYNLATKPPKVAGQDDVTGEPLTRRADDERESIVRERFEEYREKTAPVIEALRARAELGKTPMISIDATLPPEQVVERALEGLRELGLLARAASAPSSRPRV